MLNLWRWERKKDGMVKSQHMRIQPVKIDWLFCAPCLVPACLRICFWWTRWCIVVGFWFSPQKFNGVSFFTLNAYVITCNSHFEAFEHSHPERIKQIRASTCRRQIEKRRWTCLLDSKLQNEEENQNSHRLNQETIALQQNHDKKTTRVGRHGIQQQTLVISDVGCLSLKIALPTLFVGVFSRAGSTGPSPIVHVKAHGFPWIPQAHRPTKGITTVTILGVWGACHSDRTVQHYETKYTVLLHFIVQY